MEKLIEQLTELKDAFLKLSIELREIDPPHSYRTHQISEICRNAAGSTPAAVTGRKPIFQPA